MSAPATHTLEGAETIAQYHRPADWSPCGRCGIWRRTRADRNTKYCRDCRTVETQLSRQPEPEPLDGGVWVYRAGTWRWEPVPARMSAEDLAWAENNAREWAERRPVIYYRPKTREVAA